jgi:hypothetical protein
MNSLTKDDITAAAKKSKKDAILCSIRHWEEMREISTDKLMESMHDYDSVLAPFGDNCAMCIRYYQDEEPSCKKCPLFIAGFGCEENNSVWEKATDIYCKQYKHTAYPEYDEPVKNFRRKWQLLCNKMIKQLESLL